jgi:D-glycero-alpha-D-manno-heptose 1-phosphate guanylyltransferase
LGTGGAVKKAMRMTESEDVFVLNGDTFLKLDYASMFERHKNSEALFTMALKRMFNFERYGTMDVADGTVSAFNEKKPAAEGFINTGVYLMNRNIDRFFPEEDTFSFEKDFMEKKYETLRIRPFFTDAYFIDIGVPGDYVRARKEIGGVFN